MIFVCTGTQVYQFNRLLKELDRLVAEGKVTDEIFAQIGASDYKPQHYRYKEFVSPDEFKDYQDKADLIISHGGTGALIGASKMGKNIIAVPRLAKYGEHTDDHQLQVVKILENEGYVRAVYDIDKLELIINEAYEMPITRIYNRESYVLDILIKFIEESGGGKICLVSSSGGHYEELCQLKPLIEKYKGFIVTEKTNFSNKSDYYVVQTGIGERKLLVNSAKLFYQSMKVLAKEQPDIVITTGTYISLPFMIYCKMHHKRFVFIETFARITDRTKAGKMMYKYADLFLYQWKELNALYPDGIYCGSIFR